MKAIKKNGRLQGFIRYNKSDETYYGYDINNYQHCKGSKEYVINKVNERYLKLVNELL